MYAQPPAFVYALVLAVAVGVWLLITTMGVHVSGWPVMQSTFPDRDEPALRTLRGVPATMRVGEAFGRMRFRGGLTLSACASGLRVSMPWVFGPFLVPWDEIEVETTCRFVMPSVRLSLSGATLATLTLDAYPWQRLAESAGRDFGIPEEERVGRGAYARALLTECAVATGIMTGFIFLGSLSGGSPGLSLPECVAFAALVFGIPTLIRFVRMG